MIKGGVDTTIKFLIYLLVFLIVVLVFVFLFVIPQIKGYQNAKAEYNFNIKENKSLQIEQKNLISNLDIVKTGNKEIIDRFAKKFDEDKFKLFSKKYFDDVQLTKISSDINSTALKVYQFAAQIRAQNPKQFYNFVKDLDTYDGLTKINFPINISSENSVLKIDFHLSVYSMLTK